MSVHLNITRGTGLNKTIVSYRVNRSGARGPAGPTGPGGGIDYANPISTNSTGPITPTDGDYFTSTAKLMTLTGSGSQEFQPSDDDLTTVKLWGQGSGSAAITLTINPANLADGDRFEIALEEGESRLIIYDGADFIRKGGVGIPFCFYMWNDGDVASIAEGVWNHARLNTAEDDPGGIVDTGSSEINLKRNAKWNIGCRFSVNFAGTSLIKRIIAGLTADDGSPDHTDFTMIDAYPKGYSTPTPSRLTGVSLVSSLTTANSYYLDSFAISEAGGSTFTNLGENLGIATALFGEEIVPW